MSSGGGDGGAGARQEQEEQRKAELRRRIDALYGMGPGEARPVMPEPRGGMFGSVVNKIAQQAFPQKVAEFEGNLSASERAALQMEQEKKNIADSTRGYYTDRLGDQYEDAARQTKFKLARRGQTGGSQNVFEDSELREDRDLGATRVDEAVRRAISGLESQREQERLNAIQLVNSGAGQSAVSAAQAGIKNAFENVSSEQKVDLFGDLFTGAVDARAGANMADRDALLAARYRDRLGAFFPTRDSSSSGRRTASN